MRDVEGKTFETALEWVGASQNNLEHLLLANSTTLAIFSLDEGVEHYYGRVQRRLA